MAGQAQAQAELEKALRYAQERLNDSARLEDDLIRMTEDRDQWKARAEHFEQQRGELAKRLEQAMERLGERCLCQFDNGVVVEECHYHAGVRCVPNENGDPGNDTWEDRARRLEFELQKHREAEKWVDSLGERVLQEKCNELRRELDDAKRNYENACQTIAKMHEAAVGKSEGPKRGVVEDIEDLRAERDQWKAEHNAILDAVQQAEAIRDANANGLFQLAEKLLAAERVSNDRYHALEAINNAIHRIADRLGGFAMASPEERVEAMALEIEHHRKKADDAAFEQLAAIEPGEKSPVVENMRHEIAGCHSTLSYAGVKNMVSLVERVKLLATDKDTLRVNYEAAVKEIDRLKEENKRYAGLVDSQARQIEEKDARVRKTSSRI